ncbi:hypothetical protein SeseC_00741 [Streptococcus equi subsp. zooepidemicus ATCC 35246]|nr:hypothetical protein SeseC_00741 [Streptococcus equi subsp. zooepidemicus ATCC 35246]
MSQPVKQRWTVSANCSSSATENQLINKQKGKGSDSASFFRYNS